MKKIIYIALFTILGIVVQFLLHAVIEIGYIALLLNYYDIFGLSIPLATWSNIHTVFAIIFLVLGIIIGFRQGGYWWKRIYGSSPH